MKDEVYLVATADGVARMTKRWPNLARDEIGVRVRITIPDGAFRSPVLTASLEVSEGAVLQPTVEMEVELPAEDEAPNGD